MTDRVVFAGPSLTAADLAGFPQIRFLPPVADGDLFALSATLPRVVGIIDGYFGDRLAIGHKEILWTMARGTQVVGGASMGALRAAELDVYGMEGVGEVYRGYRSGRLTDDADVAVAHAPAELGYQALSVAAVDVAETLSILVERGQLTGARAAELANIAKTLHFADRSWSAMAQAAAPTDPTELEELLVSGHVQRKRIDARDLVARVSACDLARAGPPPYEPPLSINFRRQMLRGLKD